MSELPQDVRNIKRSDPAHDAETREIPKKEVAPEVANEKVGEVEEGLKGEDDETPEGHEQIKPVDGKYLWGFKQVVFNEEGDPMRGREKFQSLLDLFQLKPHPETAKRRRLESARSFFPRCNFQNISLPKPFEWSDEGRSLLLVTANNPISGEYSDPSMREDEIGYLGYVGIECENESRLKDFIKEFKARATYIKDESPGDRNFI